MRKAPKQAKQRNPWKIAFMSLIGLMVVLVAGMFLAVSL